MNGDHMLVVNQLPESFAALDYLIRLPQYEREKPYYISRNLPPELASRKTNLEFEAKEIKLLDIRNHEDSFNLESDGFCVMKQPSQVEFLPSSSADESLATAEYLKEAIQVVKTKMEAEVCLAYQIVFRRADTTPNPPGLPTGSQHRPDQPATNPHVDHTVDGGLKRIARHMSSEEYSKYSDATRYRMRIVNLWRPVRHISDTYPLALCDLKTVNHADDLIAADRVGSSYLGEVYYLLYREKQQWYWMSGMSPEELFLFTSFDTERPYSAVPHASFHNLSIQPGLPPRESVEVRLIVVTKRKHAITQ